jgi:hypothetical protein
VLTRNEADRQFARKAAELVAKGLTPGHAAAEGATAGHSHGPHCGDWKPGDPDWIEVTHELDPVSGLYLPAHNGEIVEEAREEAIRDQAAQQLAYQGRTAPVAKRMSLGAPVPDGLQRDCLSGRSAISPEACGPGRR